MALAQHLLKRGFNTDFTLLMRLASYEKTPQAPPKAFDKATPAPMLASPLASMMLKNKSYAESTSTVTAATPGGVVDTRELPGDAEDMDIVGVSRFEVGDGMLVRLPRLDGLDLDASCSSDDECLGISDRSLNKKKTLDVAEDGSRRRQLRSFLNQEPETYTYSGQCVEQQCQCPLPFTGYGCEHSFECLWWDPDISKWQDEGCHMAPELSTGTHFICNCSLVGSADVQVVVRQVLSAPFTVTLHVINFDDVKFFANLDENYIPLVLISVVDGVYLIAMIMALLRSNERRMRKYDRHYKFWAEQHKMRAGMKKTRWSKKMWTQMKGQHKMLRVFYQKYELGQDPMSLHTGAQKLTVLWLILLMKMTVSSMLSQTSAQSGIRQNTIWENIVLRVMIGTISASISLPASVVLDQLFWKQQRMTNAKQMHDKSTTEVQLIARAALHCTFNFMDTQQTLLRWKMVVEELRVEELREKLLASRHKRVLRLQERAAGDKLASEVDAVKSDFAESGRGASQFMSIIMAVCKDGNGSEGELIEQLLQEAARRIQRRFRLRRSHKSKEWRMYCALKVARAWRRRTRNAIGMRELDAVIIAEAAHTPLMKESFETVRAVDFSFQLWKEAALFEPAPADAEIEEDGCHFSAPENPTPSAPAVDTPWAAMKAAVSAVGMQRSILACAGVAETVAWAEVEAEAEAEAEAEEFEAAEMDLEDEKLRVDEAAEADFLQTAEPDLEAVPAQEPSEPSQPASSRTASSQLRSPYERSRQPTPAPRRAGGLDIFEYAFEAAAYGTLCDQPPRNASPRHAVAFGGLGALAVSAAQPAPAPASEPASGQASTVASEASDEQATEHKPLTPRNKAHGTRPFAMGAVGRAKVGAKRAKVAASACYNIPDKVTEKVAKTTVKRAPGPVVQCYLSTCRSVLFWRIFPWSVCVALAVVCHLQTLFVTMRIFAEFEDPNAVGLVWLQAIGVSLAIGWFLQDPIIIVVRNNMSCTKTIIRSKKYQVVEKFVVQPFRLAVNQVVNFLISLCGG